ncbi:unnamed protein product [Rhizophagus irregularis]|nr:unnamed protein product [Rhizophagus irregularis]CAB5375626.1 unnamed protein product [Rhizophagus irregularis]
MIIAFVIDVCDDETQDGLSLLDVVKNGIRNFLEYMNGRRDQYRTKYLLVSSDKKGYCIKWEYKKDENKLYKLFEQLELLQPDPSFYGSGLDSVFEYLNFRRICRWHDFFCRGNYIEHNETSCIFWFTDGNNLDWLNNGLMYPDSEKSSNIYREKYRWEQRLYTFYLSKSNSFDFPRQLEWINMKMLGQLYKVQTLEQIAHAFNNIIGGIKNDPYPLSKLNHMRPLKKTCGVHLNLVEQVDGSPERINHFVHIYVDPYKINGTYPIPEEYWIEPDAMKGFSQTVVYEHKRPSIPTIIFWKTDQLSADTFDLPPHFSRDIYTLSDCDLSREILKQKIGIKWPVYVEHSGRQNQSVLGQPFGYLTAVKKDEYTTEACLVLLPYNYIELASLLRSHNMYVEPPMDWKKAFERYLHNIPWYYYSILSNTLKHYGIYGNIFPMLNLERYDSWCKQLTKEAELRFNQLIDETVSNRLNLFNPLLLPKKINESDLLVAKTDSKRCELFDIMETMIEYDPKHSLPIDIMGYHIPVVKEKSKLELRDPEIYHDKVPDKRAYGNPYKNPDKYKKVVPHRKIPKWSPERRTKLLTNPTGIVFNGSIKNEVLPFKIVPGRQIIPNITKIHVNTMLPRNPFEVAIPAIPVVKTNKITNGKMRDYSTKSITPPPTPPIDKMSPANLSDVMEVDDIHNLSTVTVNGTNGVINSNYEQSMIQKASYNVIPDNKSLNGINTLKKTEPAQYSNSDFVSWVSTDKIFNNSDVLDQTKSNSLDSLRRESIQQKATVNGHSAELSLLNKSNLMTSPPPEPSGLDILSQVAQDFGNIRLGRRMKLSQRVNQRLTTLQPVKVDENLSKLAFEIKKKIQSTKIGDESIINQVQEITESDFSKESKAYFVLSIQKYAIASSKKDLSKKLQPIIDNLQSGLTKRVNSRLTKQLNFVKPRQN